MLNFGSKEAGKADFNQVLMRDVLNRIGTNGEKKDIPPGNSILNMEVLHLREKKAGTNFVLVIREDTNVRLGSPRLRERE